jgi:hypothetical protein
LFGPSWDVPNLHLTKVAVGCRDLAALRRRNSERAIAGQRRVATRMRPRRADELVGGSLYWIVRHRLIACQQILGFEDRADGRIDIVCSSELTEIAAMPRRAHQGWRYLDSAAAAPADTVSGVSELPPQLYGHLAALCLV